MKFAEMPYQRVDTEAVVAALKELTQELKAAKSGEEQFEIHQKFYALRDEYNTTIQIAMIRSDVDTADESTAKKRIITMRFFRRSTIRRQSTEKHCTILRTEKYWKRRSEKWQFKSMELEFKAME